jgi:iron complex transport system substrate-binding protein
MSKKTGYSIFAHSRPDKIGTPRLLPPCEKSALDYRQKKPLKHYILLCIFLLFTFYCLLSTNVYAEPPQRIVSLAPSTTEILFAIGLGDNVVGVTSFCDYPDEAKKKPKIGGMSNPSLEAVVLLRPDIVAVTTDGNPKEFEERLRSLDIKTYVFTARRIFELPSAVREMGSVFGAEGHAEKLADDLDEAIEKFRERKDSSETGSSKKKVLFIVWPEPLIVAGPGTAIHDAITLLGAENIAGNAKTAYPKYSIEEVIYQSPDVIFIGRGMQGNMKGVSRVFLEKLTMVPAVMNGHVYFVSDSLYRLGPRVVRGIEELAVCLE